MRRAICATAVVGSLGLLAPTVSPVAAQAVDGPTPSTSPAPASTPTPAQAVGPWSPPEIRRLPGLVAEHTTVDLFPAGPRTIARVITSSGSRDVTSFARLAADGTLGTRRAPKRPILAGPVFDRRGRGTVALDLGRGRFGLATMAPDGKIGIGRPLGTTDAGVRLAVNDSGDLVVAWLDRNTPFRDPTTGYGRYRVRVAIRPTGRAFRKTETLPIGASESHELTAAIGSSGRLVVAVTGASAPGPSRVTAWPGTARGGLGSRQTVGRHASSTALNAAVTTEGGVVLAWGTQSVGGTAAFSGRKVRAAVLAPRARTFSAMRELDPGGPNVVTDAPVALLADSVGGALIAWDNLRRNGKDVSLATVSRSGRLSPRRTVASDASGSRIATGPGGAAVLTWQLDGASRALFRAPRKATFGVVESLPTTEGLAFAQPYFQPSTGRLTVAGTQVAGDRSGLDLVTTERRP